MNPHPRIRKTVKWTSAATTVLFLTAWVWSGWHILSWTNGRGVFMEVSMGSIAVWNVKSPTFPAEVRTKTNPFRLAWGRFDYGFYSIGWYCIVPLWSPAVLTLSACAAATLLDRRSLRLARSGRCPKCNYDRTGLTTNVVCPECGSTPS